MAKNKLAFSLIGLGILLLIFGLGYGYYLLTFQRVGSLPLPDQLISLPLSSRIIGPQALKELSWLHGQEFELNKGAVGTYGEGSEITLYVAGTPLNFMAGRLVVAMRDKIARADTPFTPIAEREQGGRIVYELQGMGQRHFYFRSNDLVVWLAVDEVISDAALNQVLDFYP